MPAKTADEINAEQTRTELKEETKDRRRRRYRIEISEADRYMLTRPIERLLPHERTPNERAFLKFLEDLPNYENGAIIKSPGPKKRPRKLEPIKSKSRRKSAQKAAKKVKPAKRYGKQKAKSEQKVGEVASSSAKKKEAPAKRRRSWRDNIVNKEKE